MRRRKSRGRGRSAAVVLAAVVGGVGCSSAPPTAAESVGAVQPTRAEVAAAQPSAGASAAPAAPSPSPSSAASAASAASASSSSSAPSAAASVAAEAPSEATGAAPLRRVQVDQEQRHPNGTQVRLTGLAVDEQTIKAQVEVINGGDQEVVLNMWGEDTAITDDQGGRYPLLAPEDNTDLEVEAGSSMVGELVFAGRVPPEVSSLELVFNAVDGKPADAGFADVAMAPRLAFTDLELSS